MRLMPIACVLVASCVMAQDAAPARSTAAPENSAQRRHDLVIPSGTKVPLVLKHGLSTKTARVGDNIYASTSFPVAVDGRMAIPAGTYVQGEVTDVKRGGHVKGRAEVLIHFRTMIFPSGYTVALPGGVSGPPQTESGASGGNMKDEEGTIQADSDTGKKAGTVAKTAVSGAMVGAIASGGKGAAIGSAVGGVAGMAIAMLSRGSDVQLPPGTSLEMVFQRSLILDDTKLAAMRKD